jgi:hypothetical protein
MLAFVVIELVVGAHHVDLFAIQLDDQVFVRLVLVERLVQRDVILPWLVGERIMSLLGEPSLMRESFTSFALDLRAKAKFSGFFEERLEVIENLDPPEGDTDRRHRLAPPA